MKKFVFPLQQIRGWNATRLQLEESELEALADRLRQAEAAYTLMCTQRSELEHQTLRQATLVASDLANIEQFRIFAAAETRRVLAIQADLAQQIAERRVRIIELRRKIELLDRLRTRQHDLWSKEEAKELQTAADEAFLQKLVANQRVRK